MDRVLISVISTFYQQAAKDEIVFASLRVIRFREGGGVQVLRNIILKNPYQLFLSILLPFLVCTLIVIFTQSSFLNRNFEKVALRMVYSQQRTDLQNTSRNVSMMEQTLRSISTTAFFDETVKDLLYYDVVPENYGKYLNKLAAYKNIYPILQSIYIYNGRRIYAVPNENFAQDRLAFDDQGIFPVLDDMKRHPSHSIILRQIPNPLAGLSANRDKFIYVYSYLFFDSQLRSGKVSEAIVLNVNESMIRESISSSDPNSLNFMIDRDGNILSNDLDQPLLSSLKETNYVRWILANPDKTGTTRADVNGVDSFITFAATDVFDWKLVSITPYRHIIADVERMKERTYWFALYFIVGSLLVLFYLTRRLYLPIKQVIHNYKVLEAEKMNLALGRKKEFLRKMIQTAESRSLESFREEFSRYRIKLEPGGRFLMMVIKIDEYSQFVQSYDASDRSLLKYGIENIVDERLSADYTYESIDCEEDHIVILLQYPSADLPSDNGILVSHMQEIQRNIDTFLKLSATFTYSEPFESLHDVNRRYLNTLDLSYNRLIFGHQSFIFHEHAHARDDGFKYPTELDKKMTDALIQGQIDDAKKALSDIVDIASRYSFTILNSSFVRLLLSIRHVMEVLENNQSVKVEFNWNLYLSKLQKIETLDHIKADFNQLFDNLAEELELNKEQKYRKLLDDVANIIHSDLANPDLALDLIASKVNLSPAYLGKLFKKHRLISITEYINNYRLAHAADLIASSDETINAILEKSGYLSRSHFFTLFKKTYGVTPNQYRSHARITRENGVS